MNNLPAAQLDKKTAIQNIAGQFPAEADYLQAIISKDVVALGTDDAFALRDADGEIRAFKQRLDLSVTEGTLIQPVYNGPYVISAQGYEVWAEAAGASVIFPKEVLVDGQWCQNPAVVRDSTNRRILCIYARAVAFRFSSKGIPQISDWTTIFDTPSYRLIDLLGKAKKYPQAFRLLPGEMGAPEEKGTWASYPFDESTTLWVNTAHEEALTWYAQILNREKKAIDFAQTFARRNALKHLSGLQKVPGDKPQWSIPILCWRPMGGNIIKWDASRYSQVQDRVSKLIENRGADFATDDTIDIPPAKTMTGSERVSDEPEFEAIEQTIDPEDQTELPRQEPDTISPVKTKALDPEVKAELLAKESKTLAANFTVTREEFPVEFKKACISLKLAFGDGVDYSDEQMTAIMKRVNELVDQF